MKKININDCIIKCKVTIISIGLAMVMVPFINIIIDKFTNGIISFKVLENPSKLLTSMMFVGIFFVYVGCVGFAADNIRYKSRILKLVIFFISIFLLGIISLFCEKESFLKDIIIIISYTNLVWQTIEVLIQVIFKIWNFLKGLDAKQLLTIILPILALIISIIFKVDFNFK